MKRKTELNSSLIRYGQSATLKDFARILLEETERYWPVVEENEKDKTKTEGKNAFELLVEKRGG